MRRSQRRAARARRAQGRARGRRSPDARNRAPRRHRSPRCRRRRRASVHASFAADACTNASSVVGSSRESRLATDSGSAPSRIRFTGSSSFLPGPAARDAGHGADESGTCRGDRLVRSAATSRSRSVVAEVAVCGDDEQDELARPAVRVFEVDHQAVADLGKLLDNAVEVRGADAHTAAVESGVRASGDRPGCPARRSAPSRPSARHRGTCRSRSRGIGGRRCHPRTPRASMASACVMTSSPSSPTTSCPTDRTRLTAQPSTLPDISPAYTG